MQVLNLKLRGFSSAGFSLFEFCFSLQVLMYGSGYRLMQVFSLGVCMFMWYDSTWFWRFQASMLGLCRLLFGQANAYAGFSFVSFLSFW